MKTGGGENDAAVIIGIERYAVVAGVPGAKENARDWFKYLRAARNVPLSSITLLLDEEATIEKMRRFATEDVHRALLRAVVVPVSPQSAIASMQALMSGADQSRSETT